MSIEVFGITGTNGKTTTSYMLKGILEEAGKKCGLIGTVKHEIGEKTYEAINTTPSSALLSRYFLDMEEQGIGNCIMEVSSHGLVQGRVENVGFDYTGFTNLSRDHLDYHENMEDYFQAKMKLFYKTKKAACINVDDAYGIRLYDSFHKSCGADFFSISLKDINSDFYGKLLSNTIEGIVLDTFYKGESLGAMTIPMLGYVNAYNGLLAFSLAYLSGVDVEDILKGMLNMPQIPGRFQRVSNDRGYNIIIDFAHTPDALEQALRAARALDCKRLICVFGCGGNRDVEKRPQMGAIAGSLADVCIITSDNPRQEEPRRIIEDIEKGMEITSSRYIIEEDREKAIRMAVELYEDGDLILVAGKGHEKYQIIKNKKYPFDDERVVLESINMKE